MSTDNAQTERSRRWYDANKQLANDRSKAWHAERREAINAKRRADFQKLKDDPIRYSEHLERERVRCKGRYARKTPEQKKRITEQTARYYRQKPEAGRRAARNSHRKARMDCLQHYGGQCTCCGEATIEFLAIDHIDGGGNRHRRELGLKSLFFHLRARGYPPGFQVLCHNCNNAKGNYGSCPHTRVNQAATTNAPSSIGT